MVLKRPTYHLSERICPYCDNINIRYSNKAWLHVVRRLRGSYKRYCPQCDAKWRIKLRSSSKAMQEIWVVIFGASLGILVFYGFSIFRENLPSGQSIQEEIMMGAMAQGDEIIQSLGGEGSPVLGYKSAQEIYKLAPLQHKREASGYMRKLSQASPERKREMLDRAQTYIKQYQGASDDEKGRLIQEARRKLRSMKG